MTRPIFTASSLRALAIALLLPGAAVLAQDKPGTLPPTAKTPPPHAPADARPLTVAVLDFESKDPENPDLGRQLAEIISATLSGEPGFTLVDRSSIEKMLKEQELNVTGLASEDQSVKIGKLVGARVIVCGKVFPSQQQLYLTAKLIGTETSLTDVTLVKGANDAPPDELATRLAAAIAKEIRDKGKTLIAGDDNLDPVPTLKAKLKGLELPRVAVIIGETQPTHRVTDPPVETELKKMLIECGFAIQDVPQNDLAAWAKDMSKDDIQSWPRSLSKVDVVITGASFSEFGAQIGNLASCSARAEVNMISRHDGRVIFADRVNTRGVDLAEGAAGKKALENAGRQLGVRILQHFAKTLPPKGEAPKVDAAKAP